MKRGPKAPSFLRHGVCRHLTGPRTSELLSFFWGLSLPVRRVLPGGPGYSIGFVEDYLYAIKEEQGLAESAPVFMGEPHMDGVAEFNPEAIFSPPVCVGSRPLVLRLYETSDEMLAIVSLALEVFVKLNNNGGSVNKEDHKQYCNPSAAHRCCREFGCRGFAAKSV